MSHAATPTLTERLARRYARLAVRRPFAVLAVALAIVGACGWYGSGIQIRSDLADLFPESTPAVQVARVAQDTLKSAAQLTLMIGSPDRAKNRAIAERVCATVKDWPEVAALDCRREVEFFRKHGALFLSVAELEQVDRDVAEAVRKATERQLVDDALTEGLDDAATPTAPQAAGPAMAAAPADAISPTTASRFKLPTDDDLKKRFAGDDIREWDESADGTALAVRIFPTIAQSDVEKSAAFVQRLRDTVDRIKAEINPPATVAMSGDYAEMSAEISSIRSGLLVTSTLALLVIAAIQVLHFRRWRALLLMTVPLLASSALTLAFANGTLGYLNVITAFIFSMLFGMGNDFNVYTLSRYHEERAAGRSPAQAVEETAAGMVRALHQAALTTSVAFFALTVLEFRGFSQFGLIAGVGVELALLCTLGFFPPLIIALDRLSPDRPVTAAQAAGARWMGAVADPRFARFFLVAMGLLTLASFFIARNYDFETDFRKLRTVVSQRPPQAGEAESPQAERKRQAQLLEEKVRAESSGRTGSPIVVVADSVQDAAHIHAQLEAHRGAWHRVRYFVSIHSFVAKDQASKLPIIERIAKRLRDKREALTGQDAVDADRALDLLPSRGYGPNDLPDFVRKRFLDKHDRVGRFVLIYARGNLAEANSIREVTSQVGQFRVPDGAGGERVYRSTASFFILAEADDIVRKEGPIAVLLAALAVFAVILWHFGNLRLCLYSFAPLVAAFVVFLALAHSLDQAMTLYGRDLGLADLPGLSLNLFSVTTLPGILGIGIDGTTHILHRWYEEGDKADVRQIVQQVGGAAWIALLTTTVGFATLMFQDNRGMQTIGAMATLGLFSVCLLANLIAGALLAVWPPKRSAPTTAP
ncbi:MAG: MMPL family transporter [Deltaproteobacteria bacterium]|nr:MMPL family transporter [Deltaproteobacteria bacterium]